MNDSSSRRKRASSMRRLGVLLVAGLLLLLSRVAPDLFSDDATSSPGSGPIVASQPQPDNDSATEQTAAQLETGRERILEAFEKQQSGVWVEADGWVIKKLRDDNEGSRHQKFLLELPQPSENGDLTLLVSHNIDLAPRIPLGEGDRIVFRGRYEWNDRGGVIHWTHHDPRGRGPGGWITHDGKTYR